MPTQSPFSFLDALLGKLETTLAPPGWLVQESQRKLLLIVNHVLMTEPAAVERLVRQKGRQMEVRWRQFSMRLVVTPAGMFDLVAASEPADLQIMVTETSPSLLAQQALRGEKPPVRIEGDIQLAAEINWLVDHVRWDIEEDVARAIGDVPAHTLGRLARAVVAALRQLGRPGRAMATEAGAGAR